MREPIKGKKGLAKKYPISKAEGCNERYGVYLLRKLWKALKGKTMKTKHDVSYWNIKHTRRQNEAK